MPPMPGRKMDTTNTNTNTDMADMSDQLEPLSGPAFDILYMQMMIEHHQAAIDMSQLVSARATQPDLVTLASDIITAQTQEIAKMTAWLLLWYNVSPSLPSSDDSDMSSSSSGSMPAVYGSMSRAQNEAHWQEQERKIGRAISAANHALVTKAVKGIESHVAEMKSMLTAAQQQGYPRTMSRMSMGASSETPLARLNDDDEEHNEEQDGAELSTQLDDLLSSIRTKQLINSLTNTNKKAK